MVGVDGGMNYAPKTKLDAVPLAVPVLNNFEGLTKLMHSVRHPIYPIVVDNYNKNGGVANAWNRAMTIASLSGYDRLIIANDDIYFRGLYAIHDLNEALNNHIFVTAWEHDKHRSAGFSCFGLRIEDFVRRVGKFDENFYPAYFEDDDMRYRMKLAGVEELVVREALVEHKGSATQFKDPKNPVVNSQTFEGLRAYYIQKWGGEPGHEKYTIPFNGEK